MVEMGALQCLSVVLKLPLINVQKWIEMARPVYYGIAQ